MWLAAVCPRDPKLLSQVADRPYHLALAHVAQVDNYYAAHYRELSPQKHVLLDNGVAEDRRLDGRELFEAANAVQPAEVVLPDVVGDARATYTDSFAFLQEYGAALACNEIGFVYVLQAGEHTATEDLEWGVEAVMDLHSEWPISAVAISKFFSRDVGPRFLAVAALLNMWESIQSPPEIHLLGLHSDIVELALIERTWPGRVRGCDTSWPFIAARDGYLVGSLRDPTAYIDLMDPRAGVDVPGDILEILLDQMDKIAGGVIWPI